jgi:hypothetical protein
VDDCAGAADAAGVGLPKEKVDLGCASDAAVDAGVVLAAGVMKLNPPPVEPVPADAGAAGLPKLKPPADCVSAGLEASAGFAPNSPPPVLAPKPALAGGGPAGVVENRLLGGALRLVFGVVDPNRGAAEVVAGLSGVPNPPKGDALGASVPGVLAAGAPKRPDEAGLFSVVFVGEKRLDPDVAAEVAGLPKLKPVDEPPPPKMLLLVFPLAPAALLAVPKMLPPSAGLLLAVPKMLPLFVPLDDG